MLQNQAQAVISDLRNAISRGGYDRANKQHLAVLFSDLVRLYSDAHHDKLDPEKHKQVVQLQTKWQKDRLNEVGGSDTINAILNQIARYIPDLPTEAKPCGYTLQVPALDMRPFIDRR